MPETASLIAWLFIGLMAGIAARSLVSRDMGLLETTLAGLLGAVLGGYLFDALGLTDDLPGLLKKEFNLADLLVATIGAIILIMLARVLARRR